MEEYRLNKKILYWSIELNLILWLVFMVFAFSEKYAGSLKVLIITGVLFSAILQHWAYYKYMNDSYTIKVPVIVKFLLALLIIALIFFIFIFKY